MAASTCERCGKPKPRQYALTEGRWTEWNALQVIGILPAIPGVWMLFEPGASVGLSLLLVAVGLAINLAATARIKELREHSLCNSCRET